MYEASRFRNLKFDIDKSIRVLTSCSTSRLYLRKERKKKNIEEITHLELLLALTFLFETHPFLVFLVVTPLGSL